MMLLPIALAACAASDEGSRITYTDDRGVSSQPFPNNYRTEVLAFMKTYLNNPGWRARRRHGRAGRARVGGRLRYVVASGSARARPTAANREPRERAMLFVDGRLDRIVENAGEPCAGAVYAPFAELEKMTR